MSNYQPPNRKLNDVLHTIYNDTCFYCGKSCDQKGHIDHIVPIAQGGKDKLYNFILACPNCNIIKNSNILSKPKIQNALRTARNMKPILEKYLKLTPQNKEMPFLKQTPKLHVVDFPGDVRYQAKMAALRQNITLREWVINAFTEKLEREEKK